MRIFSFSIVPFLAIAWFALSAWPSSPAGEINNGATYFKANGSEPAWNLEIKDDKIVFSAIDFGFDRMILPHVEPVKASIGNIRTYTVKSESTELTIEIAQMLCDNPHSKERFPYGVTVSVKRATDKVPLLFTGCGLYVPDSRLQGRWVIQKIKNDSLPDSIYNYRIPYLELGVSSSYFTTDVGCKMVSGRLYFERNLFRFTDFVIQKDTCPYQSIQNDLVKALQFTTQYSIHSDELTLGNPTQTLVVLTKQR